MTDLIGTDDACAVEDSDQSFVTRAFGGRKIFTLTLEERQSLQNMKPKEIAHEAMNDSYVMIIASQRSLNSVVYHCWPFDVPQIVQDAEWFVHMAKSVEKASDRAKYAASAQSRIWIFLGNIDQRDGVLQCVAKQANADLRDCIVHACRACQENPRDRKEFVKLYTDAYEAEVGINISSQLTSSQLTFAYSKDVFMYD